MRRLGDVFRHEAVTLFMFSQILLLVSYGSEYFDC